MFARTERLLLRPGFPEDAPALFAAIADVRAGRGGAVPKHLRDGHYPGSAGLGHGAGYRYPHDDSRGVVTQQYAPDELSGTDYYRPTDHGAERAVGERLPRLRRIVRGHGPAPTGGTVSAGGDTGGGPGPAAPGGPGDEIGGSAAGEVQ